jgi:DNA-binding beta-propeller fold protein YncE
VLGALWLVMGVFLLTVAVRNVVVGLGSLPKPTSPPLPGEAWPPLTGTPTALAWTPVLQTDPIGPWLGGLALDASGNVYVIDQLGGTGTWDEAWLRKLSPDLQPLAEWRVSGPGASTSLPVDVAVADDGTVYLLDGRNDLVQVYSPDGQLLRSWGVVPTPPRSITGGPVGAALAVDHQGLVYVGEDYGVLRTFDTSGQQQTVWSKGLAHTPLGLTVNEAGQLLVADADGHQVQALDAAGQVVGSWGSEGPGPGQLQRPLDVALDRQGRAYVADAARNRIQVFAPDGPPLWTLGRGGSGPGELAGPRALALGADDSLYVADSGNHRVQKLAPDGHQLAQWGTLPQPSDVQTASAAADGSLYVSSSRDLRTYHLSADGQVLDSWPLLGPAGEEPDLVGPTSRGPRYPDRVVVDSQGRTYVVYRGWDAIPDWVAVVAPHGWMRPAWTSGFPPPSVWGRDLSIHRIDQLTFDPMGNVLVVDGRDVLVFTPDGGPLSHWSAPPYTASAYSALHVAVDNQGQRYVLDSSDHVWELRKLATDGTTVLAQWTTSNGQASLPTVDGLMVAPDGRVLVVAGRQVVQLIPDLQPTQLFRLDGVPSGDSKLGRVTLGPELDLLLPGEGEPVLQVAQP